MFFQVKCVKVLFLLFASNAIAVSNYGSQHQFSTQENSCEDMTGFFHNIQKVSPAIAFQIITRPLDCPRCPIQVKQFRYHLTRLISNGLLDITGILKDLQRIGSLNRNDVLLTTFMAMNEFLVTESYLKKAISDTIFYLLRKRFLRIESFNSANSDFCPTPKVLLPTPVDHVQESKDDCACQMEMFNLFLNRMLQIDQQRRKLFAQQRNLFNNGTSDNASYYSDVKQEANYTEVINKIRRIVPKPMFASEEVKYDQLMKWLDTPIVKKIIRNRNLERLENPADILGVITKEVLNTVKGDEPREVFKFYSSLKKVNETNFNLANLIFALPQPKTPKETRLYNILKNQLLDESVYDIKLSKKFSKAPTLQLKLQEFLKDLTTYDRVPKDVLEASQHFAKLLTPTDRSIDVDNVYGNLPSPQNDTERPKFDILNKYLLSKSWESVTAGDKNKEHNLMRIIYNVISTEQNSEIVEAATYYRNKLIALKAGFNYFDLLNLIPATNETKILTSQLLKYFYSAEFQAILSQLNFSGLADMEKLLLILENVLVSTTDVQIRSSVEALILILEKQIFFEHIDNVIRMIPIPKNAIDAKNYKIVTDFLRSQRAFEILSNLDFTVFPNNKLLVEYIFKSVLESVPEKTIKDAFEYYIDLTEKLASIEFVTRKEIKKRFKLTDIFVDTLDLKSMNLAQKDAFKKFFKFILEIQPSVMVKFDSWDQAKTRGEFMKLLFKYLLSLDDINQEIKECILVLNSLVVMTGKGALPP